MEITRQKIDNTLERKLVTHCITSTPVLAQVSKLWKQELAKAPYSAKVIRWCIEHYEYYNTAPKEHIMDLYLAHKHTLDDSLADPIGQFLHSLNEDYTETGNTDYVIDQTVNYLRLRAVEVFQEQLKLATTNKDYVEAERLIANFSKVGISSHDTVDFTALETTAIAEAFNKDETTLFRLPGALGAMIGDVKATDFVHFLSPAKMGKSFFLQWMGIHAMCQGCNVLELSYEMVKDQRIRRWWQAVNCSPKHDSKVPITYFYQDSSNSSYKIGTREEHRKAVDYSPEAIEQFYKDFRQMYPTGNYKLQCHISKTHTVKDIRTLLTNLEVYENYVPNVLILDHPALLNYSGKGQGWEMIGDLYAELRGLATEYNIALVTASHSTRNSYNANKIDESMVGKSIDILNHITSGVSITSTKAEKEAGIYRASQLVEREGRTYSDQVLITSCLDLGLPHTDSRFLSECEYNLPKEEKDKEKD